MAICIATMRRPIGLLNLLRTLNGQRFAKVPIPDLVVIVCDNDPERSALEPVRQFREGSALTIRYVHEPRPGISYARNACIRVAMVSDCQALAFIDDDETPEPHWLEELLIVRARFNAHVVTGPVKPIYEDGVPRWMIRARLFERPDYETGTILPVAAAGNVLAVREVVDAVGTFDKRLALSGGEDTHFFWRARARGAAIVWAKSAVVYETVPVTRARINWLVRRAWRLQNGYVFCERELLPLMGWMPRRVAKTLGISARGLCRLIVAPIVGRAMFVRGLCDIARAMGGTVGACGALYEEYRTIHGH